MIFQNRRSQRALLQVEPCRQKRHDIVTTMPETVKGFMTPQHLFHIDFNEITALEVTCKCGSVVKIPLPADNLREDLSCVGCNTTFWGDKHDKVYLYALGLIRALTHWKRYCEQLEDKRTFNLGFSIDQEP